MNKFDGELRRIKEGGAKKESKEMTLVIEGLLYWLY